MKPKHVSLVASVGFAALLWGPSLALAQTAPSLGTAQSFAVLGGSTVTNTGTSTVSGDLGVSPGTAITGFPPGIVVGGTIHAADAVALSAQNDVTTAYNALGAQACTADLTGQDLGGKTLTAGVYCFSTSAQLTGTLILDAQGNANAVFIFKIGSTLTTASNAVVVVSNGAQTCNVFWQVGTSATLGVGSTIAGNILALSSITLNTNARLFGRALARNGAVTLDTNSADASVCTGPPPPPPLPPTLGKGFIPIAIGAGGVSTFTITLINPNTSVASLVAAFTDTLPSGLVIAATPNASTTCAGSGAVAATPGGTTVTLPATRSIPAGGGTTAGTCTVTVDVTAPLRGVYLNTLAANAL